MADQCADCGADGEIYIGGIPVCLVCAEIRDAKACLVPDGSTLDTLERARKEYRLAIENLQNAKSLLSDLEAVNRDGSVALKQARARFMKAKDNWAAAADAFLEQARGDRKKS